MTGSKNEPKQGNLLLARFIAVISDLNCEIILQQFSSKRQQIGDSVEKYFRNHASIWLRDV